MYHVFLYLSLILFALSGALSLRLERAVSPLRKRNSPASILLFSAALSLTLGFVSQYHGAAWEESAALLLAGAVAWVAVIVSLRSGLTQIGMLVSPLCTLLLFLHLFSRREPQSMTPGLSASILGGLHVLTAILGQAFALCAAAAAAIFLVQRRALKRKQLPHEPAGMISLDRMERLLTFFLWIGFVFISIGMVSGAIYTHQFVGELPTQFISKVVWASLVWVWYLMILMARRILRLNTRRVALLSMGGAALLTLSFFGLSFFRTWGM